LLPFVFTVSFSIIAIVLSEFLSELVVNFKLSIIGKTIFGFFNQRFLVEFFYNKYITNLVLNLGGQTVKILDKGSIELLGPYGLETGLIKVSKNISYLNQGIVTNYALFILVGFITYNIVTLFVGNISILITLILLLGFLLPFNSLNYKR